MSGSRATACTSEEQLALFASGDLDGPELGTVRAHLSGCSHCQDVVAEFRATRLWLQRGREMSLDPRVLEQLQQELEARLLDSPPPSRWIAMVLRARETIGRGRAMAAASRAGRLLQPVVAIAVSVWLVVGAILALSSPQPLPVMSGSPQKSWPTATGAAFEPQLQPQQDDDGQALAEEVPDPVSKGLRIEMRTQDPNVRIIWFAANEASRFGGR